MKIKAEQDLPRSEIWEGIYMQSKKKYTLPSVILIYLLCFAFRIFEYFVLRTDETFWGEAFVHKLIGIVILLITAKYLKFTINEIGFKCNRIWPNLLSGFVFGLLVFVPAYLTEIVLTMIQGKFEALALYVSAYSVNGTVGNQTDFIFFTICIAGNIINVIMEEGVFRGLFQKILEKKYSFIVSAIIGSCLFGFWHIMAPARSFFDGAMSYNGFIANAILLVFTSSLIGFEFAIMTKITGSLYMAMGHHFINNAIVNMLHVVSNTGADEFMVIRIAIAQSISFVIILIWYISIQRKKIGS